jgi:hypothetical protein
VPLDDLLAYRPDTGARMLVPEVLSPGHERCGDDTRRRAVLAPPADL